MISTTQFLFFTISITTFSWWRPSPREMKSKRNLSFPMPPPRHVSPSQNHHAITLIRVSFIFRSPFFSFLLPPFLSSQTKFYPRQREGRESTNFEVPVGFWCSHQLFPSCKIVNHALSADKATNNSSILDG